MNKYELRGGARIGKLNATYPFGKLTVTKDKLEINASLIGRYVFRAQDIISIKPYDEIPLIGKGIKINHNVANYDEKVVFWTFDNPKRVIYNIKKIGFFPIENAINNPENATNNPENELILKQQKQLGSPFKKTTLFLVIIFWNIIFGFFILKSFLGIEIDFTFFTAVKFAIGLVFIFGILALKSKSFQKIILKKNREIEDVKSVIYFLLGVSGFILTILLIITS